MLQGKSPAEAARDLISNTKLDDVAVRKQLYEGGQAAIEASTDPLIGVMRAIDPGARTARKEYEDKVESVVRRDGAKPRRRTPPSHPSIRRDPRRHRKFAISSGPRRRNQLRDVSPVAANIMNGPIGGDSHYVGQPVPKKNGVLGLAHLSRGVGKFAMLDGAFAADVAVPVYKAPPIVYSSWTGVYAGLEAGYKWSDMSWNTTCLGISDIFCPFRTAFPIDASNPRGFDPASARIGGYIGYNWQFAPSWLVGIEGDAVRMV